jgi:hypothetical protein
MAVMSTIAGALSRGAMEGVAEGALSNAVKGAGTLAQSKFVQQIIQDKGPAIFGLSFAEEAEFGAAKDCLAREDQRRIDSVAKVLGGKFLKRWQMMLATMENEGLVYNPKGPLAGKQKRHDKLASGNWGKSSYLDGHAHAGGPVNWTEQDRRVVHLQGIADMVAQPGPGIQPNSKEAVQAAVDSLMATSLNDYSFGQIVLGWFKSSFEWTKKASVSLGKEVQETEVRSVALLIKFVIGDVAFQSIMTKEISQEEKVKLFEQSLESVIRNKQYAVRLRRGLPDDFLRMLKYSIAIMAITAFVNTYFW